MTDGDQSQVRSGLRAIPAALRVAIGVAVLLVINYLAAFLANRLSPYTVDWAVFVALFGLPPLEIVLGFAFYYRGKRQPNLTNDGQTQRLLGYILGLAGLLSILLFVMWTVVIVLVLLLLDLG